MCNDMEELQKKAVKKKLYHPWTLSIPFDNSLELSNANFNKLVWFKGEQELRYPSLRELAAVADAAYKEPGQEVLPAGYHVLTRGWNKDWGNAYHGLACWHRERRQVIIAHRGTSPSSLSALWTDVVGIVLNNGVEQISSAATFVDIVLSRITAVIGPHFQIMITGHSLGGWLSQVTAYTSQYLSVTNGLFLFTDEKPFHPHVVAFESPGCEERLVAMRNEFETIGSDSLTRLDITTYLSSPNLINCYKQHLGSLYRLYPQITVELLESSSYTWKVHSLQLLLDILQEPNPKIQRIVDWPVTGAFFNRDEYERFFYWARQFLIRPTEDVISSFKKEISRNGEYFPVRYQTQPCQNEISARVFTVQERQFLKNHQDLRPISANLGIVENHVETWLTETQFEADSVVCKEGVPIWEFVPSVKKLYLEHPWYFYEKFSKKNQKYFDMMGRLKFQNKIVLTEKLTILLASDPVLTASRLLEGFKGFLLLSEDLIDLQRTVLMVKRGGRFIIILSNTDNLDNQLKEVRKILEVSERIVLAACITCEKEIVKEFGVKGVNMGEVGWMELAEESKEMLLQKKLIVLQNSESLSMLEVTKTRQVESLMTPKLIRKLIFNEHIRLGAGNFKNAKFYIERELAVKSWCVNYEFFTTLHENSFVILTGIEKEHFQRKFTTKGAESTFKVVSKEEVQGLFNELCLDQTRNVYIIYVEDEQFYLSKFRGDAKKLRKFLSPSDRHGEVITEKDLLQGEERVTIISGEPGVGKTTTLERLSRDLKRSSPTSWVTLLELDTPRCTEVFTKLRNKVEFFHSNQVSGFVSSQLLLLTGLNKVVFDFCLSHDCESVLLLDGFDVVASDFAFAFLHALVRSTRVHRIFITTRNHHREDLENILRLSAYSLCIFSEQDKHNFVSHYCRTKDSVSKARSALMHLSEISKLLCNPLLLSMLLEVAEVKSLINLSTLYSEFIERKLQGYKEEKCKGSGNLEFIVGTYISLVKIYFKNLAQKFLFDSVKLPTRSEGELIQENEELLRIGLIEKKESFLQFIHLTFAEYLVAESIIDTLRNAKLKAKTLEFILGKILVDEKHTMIRRFLNEMLPHVTNLPRVKKSKTRMKSLRRVSFLHVALQEGKEEIAKFFSRLLQKTKSLQLELLTKEESGRTPSQLAVLNEQFGLLGFWMEQVPNRKFLYAEDDVGNTAIHYAMKLKEWNWLNSVKLDWTVTNDLGETLVHTAVRQGNFLLLNQLGGSAKALFSRDHNGMTPLHCAMVVEGEGKSTWLEAIREELAWKVINRYGKTPVNIAIERGNFQILEFLVQRYGVVELFSIRDGRGNTLLHNITSCNMLKGDSRTRMLDWLQSLWGKISWTDRNNYGETFLHSATKTGSFDALCRLPMDADLLRVKDVFGNTALHYAMRGGGTAAALEERLCWLNKFDERSWGVVNDEGETPVHIAVKNGNYAVLNRMQFENRSLLWCIDGDGNTPAHYTMRVEEGKEQEKWIRGLVEEEGWKLCNKNGKTAINIAAEKGNFKLLHFLSQLLIHKRGFQDRNGNTVLHAAMRGTQRCQERIRWVTSLTDIDWTVSNRFGETPVHVAAENGCFELLLQLKEPLNNQRVLRIRDRDGNTSLHSAMRSSRSKELRLWVRTTFDDFDWTATNRFDETPFHIAVMNEQFASLRDALKMPLARRLLHLRNYNGNTPLHDAMKATRVQDLLDHLSDMDWTVTNDVGQTPAHIAAKNGNFRALLGVNQDVLEVMDGEGVTPLQYVMWSKLEDVEQLAAKWQLLKTTLTPDDWMKNENGETLIHLAASMASFETLIYLVWKFIDKNKFCGKNGHYDTPLHIAMGCRELNKSQRINRLMWLQLLAFDKDDWLTPNARGETPLHIAVRTGQFDVLRSLSLPEDVLFIQDGLGNTPLSLAVVGHDPERLAWLNEMCNKEDWTVGSHAHLAAASGNFDFLNYLLAKGVNAFLLRDGDGQTPLHVAVRMWTGEETEHRAEWIRASLDERFWSTIDHEGQTPTHIAAALQHFDLLQTLSREFPGKDYLRTRDADGNTPLHLCATSRGRTSAKWLAAVVENIDLETKNNQGQTLVHCAARAENFHLLLVCTAFRVEFWNIRDESGKSPVDLVEERKNTGRWEAEEELHLAYTNWLSVLKERGIEVHSKLQDGRRYRELRKTRKFKLSQASLSNL